MIIIPSVHYPDMTDDAKFPHTKTCFNRGARTGSTLLCTDVGHHNEWVMIDDRNHTANTVLGKVLLL
jgi:hypothetical protein